MQQGAALLLASTPYAEQQARTEYEAEHECATSEQLHRMPLNRLKQLTRGEVRTTAVEASGIRTVGQLLNRRQGQLEAIQGVGPITAARLLDAARRAEDQLTDESRIRFDIERKPVSQTSLLRALYRLDVARHDVEANRPALEDMSNLIAKDIGAARLEYRPTRRFFSSRKRKDAAKSALKRIDSLLKEDSTIRLQDHLRVTEERLSDRAIRAFDVWADYTARPVHYNGIRIFGLDLAGQALIFLCMSTKWPLQKLGDICEDAHGPAH